MSIISDHVNVVRGHGDPQFECRFEVTLPAGVSGSPALVSERVVTVSPLLEEALTSEKGHNANSFYYYLQENDVSSITLTVSEFVDRKSLGYFKAWRKLLINDDGTYNAPTHYKKDIMVSILGTNWDNPFNIKYRDAWPSRISVPQASYESNEAVKIEVEITCDSIDY